LYVQRFAVKLRSDYYKMLWYAIVTIQGQGICHILEVYLIDISA